MDARTFGFIGLAIGFMCFIAICIMAIWHLSKDLKHDEQKRLKKEEKRRRKAAAATSGSTSTTI